MNIHAGGASLSVTVAESATFAFKRTASIYPLYAFSVLLAFLQMWYTGSLGALRISALASQLLLLQAWLPSEAVCLCACAREKERERKGEREKEKEREIEKRQRVHARVRARNGLYVLVFVCVCVCLSVCLHV